MSDLEIILSTVGTDGDANPFIALGKELAKRRYTVSIMTNADHEACAIGNDIGFFAMNEPDWPQINRNDSIFFRESISYGYPRAYMAIKAKLEQGKKLFLINRNGNWGTLFCAERFKIPLVRVALQPCAILEEGSPVPPMNRILVNKFRRNIGLSPLLRRSRLDFDEPVLMTISLFPSWFGEPQSNWRQSGHCVGFPFLDKPDADLTDELRRFIDLYGAPVVFSCGTGIQDVSHALNSAKWFCIKTKCPVIFLSKYASLDMGALPDAFRVYSHLDHKSLLPLAALVVHNGGMGTTAQALRAGVAQIVNPRVYDQPDNAQRVEQLGVGRTILPQVFDVETLIAAYTSLKRDPHLANNLRATSQKTSSTNAVECAVDLIEGELQKNKYSATH